MTTYSKYLTYTVLKHTDSEPTASYFQTAMTLGELSSASLANWQKNLWPLKPLNHKAVIHYGRKILKNLFSITDSESESPGQPETSTARAAEHWGAVTVTAGHGAQSWNISKSPGMYWGCINIRYILIPVHPNTCWMYSWCIKKLGCTEMYWRMYWMSIHLIHRPIHQMYWKIARCIQVYWRMYWMYWFLGRMYWMMYWW